MAGQGGRAATGESRQRVKETCQGRGSYRTKAERGLKRHGRDSYRRRVEG